MTSVVEFEAGHGDWSRQVRFASSDVDLRLNAAARIAVGLLPAMRRGVDLAVPGSIDPRLHRALATIQDIHVAWASFARRVNVSCTVAEPPARSGSRVGCFFTGGVDSFYTLLKHREEITDLIFVHGYDVALDNQSLRARVSAVVRRVGAQMGVGVVEVETNLRGLLDAHMPWGVTHGAALAAVGHLLQSEFRQIFIASSYGYADLFPWGSHPLLDPLWSDDTLAFVHDGCEATRSQKTRFIADDAVVMGHLRVCYENPGNAYNCGRCGKCLRTMINLEAVGALDRCSTFVEPLDPARVARMAVGSASVRTTAVDNLRALTAWRPDSPLLPAVRTAIRRGDWRRRWQRLRRLVFGK